MGASVIAYWPGITAQQIESQPGFYNDGKAWGNWMAEREDDPLVLTAIRKLKAEAILTVKTDGWEDDDVTWSARSSFERPLHGCAKLFRGVHQRPTPSWPATSATPTASTRSRRSSCWTYRTSRR